MYSSSNKKKLFHIVNYIFFDHLFIFTSLKEVVTPYFCKSLISLAFKVSELIATNLMMLFKNIYR